jgi:hypothetical protein
VAFCPGTAAYVTVGGTARTFDEWSVATTLDAADVSDFNRREARWLSGLPICRVTMSGPYSQGTLGMLIGQEYSIVYGVSGSMGLAINTLILAINPKTKARDAARVEVVGIANSTFLNVVNVL